VVEGADPVDLRYEARMAECIFCKIAAGEAPADRVLEDQRFVGFLDTRPVFQGHVLIVPKVHYQTLLDLPPELHGPLLGEAQRVARAVMVALGAEGSFVAMNNQVSQSVPHLHLHVVPRRKGDGLKGFFWPRVKYTSDAERAAIAERIAAALPSKF
jgi:histidine triad (HIT) family protein